ncbi:uncharacterized protein [Amphiura filiformis]|uniref:uncharacterized protein n=1 Tax=Amphiura filiformis TaxID=82378 RepID=UPI003B21D953
MPKLFKKEDEFEEGDLLYGDDPQPLTMRHNWEKNILDLLLDRITYCANECLTSPCDHNAACINNPGSFECSCNAGFSGDGLTCTDVDECLYNPCDHNAVCSNNHGSFECTCNA